MPSGLSEASPGTRIDSSQEQLRIKLQDKRAAPRSKCGYEAPCLGWFGLFCVKKHAGCRVKKRAGPPRDQLCWAPRGLQKVSKQLQKFRSFK